MFLTTYISNQQFILYTDKASGLKGNTSFEYFTI